MPPTVRPATAADLPEIALVDGRAFGVRYTDDEIENLVRPLFEPDRFLVACDPDNGGILGVTGDYPFELTAHILNYGAKQIVRHRSGKLKTF